MIPVIAESCQVIQLLEHTPANHASRFRSGSAAFLRRAHESREGEVGHEEAERGALRQRFVGEIRAQRARCR